MIYKKDTPVILPKDIFIGLPGAPVTLMEFGDYECETAMHNDLIVREVLQQFPGMVNFNYRHFPQLRIHQRAHKAAEAAIAAAQVGKFAQMHDLILRNRRNLGTASLAFYARDLGIGGINFLDSLITGKYGQYVQDDLALGLRMGIKEAPSFFINGVKFEGRITVKNLCDQVEAVCRKARTAVKRKVAKIRA
ncbi:MAG TPA: thioredoxin domain-containing protein [Puia sp.]|jgi:protein-disulfide isomerase|nr:thioredoxin domain-containing protein [Puia sp.]